ncbi:oligosaccharide flippase family protein [Vibrio breoganii]|uniref:oligosaccharide flippase family protein n=1 Tax=Vibrio breoganii TaxID=553239 RepID=UPI000C85C96D|nr:oligosaccharide flippase family protein [Vibrio breoganii]PMM49035.1 hypothetical protein BCT52_03785 [Vibrio breoganii]
MSNPLYLAIKKSVTGRLSTYLVQFSALAIYARLFTPEEFGIIASIQVFVIFFQMLADVGIGPAIINESQFDTSKRNGIFTVTILIGCVLSLSFFMFSYVLNDFYSEYEYQTVAVFICVGIFFYSLNIVPTTALNKDVMFLRLAFIDILVEVCSFVIVYLFYTRGFGVIALSARITSQAIFKFMFTWYFSKQTSIGRPLFGSEIYHIKSILSFSLYQFGFNFINYFSRNLDNILIAKYFGMASVGAYEKSYQLMRYPLMLTTFAMTPAIQPVLTKVRNDKDKILYEHNNLSMKLLFISMIIATFLYFNSNNVVLLLFGEQWINIVDLIKCFAIIIPVQSVLSTSGSFFQVLNKPKLLFISGCLSAIVNVIAICIGVYLGDVIYVALGLVLSFVFNFIQCYFILFRYCFEKPISGFVKCLRKSFFISISICISYLLLKTSLSNIIPVDLVLNLFSNGLIMMVSLLLFYRQSRGLFKL